MRWTQPLCVFLLVASATGCSSPKIGYDYDSSANFSAYHTYDWLSDKQETTGDRRVDNSKVDIRFRVAVSAQLKLKGYTHPLNGQPDFYVAYHLAVKDMTPVASQHYSDEMAARPFAYSADTRSAGAPHTGVGASASYSAGMLLLDIIDAASNKLVWRGTASGEVDPGLTSEERDERTRTIVRGILANFPPK